MAKSSRFCDKHMHRIDIIWLLFFRGLGVDLVYSVS